MRDLLVLVMTLLLMVACREKETRFTDTDELAPASASEGTEGRTDEPDSAAAPDTLPTTQNDGAPTVPPPPPAPSTTEKAPPAVPAPSED